MLFLKHSSMQLDQRDQEVGPMELVSGDEEPRHAVVQEYALVGTPSKLEGIAQEAVGRSLSHGGFGDVVVNDHVISSARGLVRQLGVLEITGTMILILNVVNWIGLPPLSLGFR